MKKITIKINKKTAKITAEAEGYVGKECNEAVSFLRNLSSNANIEHKPEYDIEPDVEVNNS